MTTLTHHRQLDFKADSRIAVCSAAPHPAAAPTCSRRHLNAPPGHIYVQAVLADALALGCCRCWEQRSTLSSCSCLFLALFGWCRSTFCMPRLRDDVQMHSMCAACGIWCS
jgi:hypothetical protein